MGVIVKPWKDETRRFHVTIYFKWPDGSAFRDRKVIDAPTQAIARKWGEARESELRAAGKPKPKAPEETAESFETFVDERWWKVYPTAAGNAPMTVREKKKHLEIHLKPFFGPLPMVPASFGKERLDGFVSALSKGTIEGMRREAGPKYVNNILATLSVILKSAVEWGVLPHMPKMPRQKAHEPSWDFLNREESEAVIAKARTPEERAILMFAFRTGARAGEQIALEWTAIDWHNHRVSFHRSSSLGEVRETTKGKRVRRVPMSPALEAALKAIKHLKGPLVFCNADGSALTLDQLHERLWGACNRAKLRRIKWHECRHSFASQLVIAGTPIRQVQEWCGHASITQTMRYSHLAPGGGREFIEALDGPEVHAAKAKRS